MKRNLKFWTRHTWDTAGVEFIMVAVFAVMTVLTSNGIDWNLFVSTVPLFLVVAAVFTVILVNSSTQMLYIPLLISMGETRRNVFFGSCYFRVLVIGVTAALCGLIWLACPGEIAAAGLGSVTNIIFVLVAASSVGGIFGTLYTKWKWVGIMCLALTGGVIGGMSGFVMSSGLDLQRSGVIKVTSFLQDLPWWIAPVAVGMLAVDLFFHWMLLRRQEVKL